MAEFTDVNKFISDVNNVLTDNTYILLYATIKNGSGRDEHTLFFLKKNDSKIGALSRTIVKGTYILIDLHTFNSSNLRAKFKDFGFVNYAASESIKYSEDDSSVVSTLFGLIATECRRTASDFGHRIIYSYLEILLTVTFRAYTTHFKQKDGVINEVDLSFSTLCNKAFMGRSGFSAELPTVDTFARILGFTKYYLNDISKVLHGRTAQDRIDEQIIAQAKRLLANTDCSVAEIAYQIGFSEPQMLNRLFKKRTKKTPLEYRISLI